MTLPAGWYPVAGDPSGTSRYWDGEAFVGTPERSALAARRAGFVRPNSATKWRVAGVITRSLAFFVDYAATLVVITSLFVANGYARPGTDVDAWLASRDLLGAIVGFWVFNQVILVGFTGRSLGRILFGLRVVDVRDRDRPPGPFRALVRLAVQFPGLPITIAMMIVGNRRGAHDVASGTSVIYV